MHQLTKKVAIIIASLGLAAPVVANTCTDCVSITQQQNGKGSVVINEKILEFLSQSQFEKLLDSLKSAEIDYKIDPEKYEDVDVEATESNLSKAPSTFPTVEQ